MKLIPLTDFVLQVVQTTNVNEAICWEQTQERLDKIYHYALFLKQPLTLGMFVPCDEEGNVLEEPSKDDFSFYTNKNLSVQEEWEQAKERVLFEGFNHRFVEFIEYEMIDIYNNDVGFIYHPDIRQFEEVDRDIFPMTIEDLSKHYLILTKSAKKQLGL